LAGPGTKIRGTSLLLFEVLQGACRLKINDHPSAVPRWGCQPRDTEDSNYPLRSLISDLNGFLDAPWWTRVWTIQESVVGKEPVFFYQTAAVPWALILEAASTLEAHVSDCCTPYLRNSALPGYANATFALIRQVQDIQRARGVYRTLRSSQPSVRALENALGPNVIPPKGQAAGLTSQALLQHLQGPTGDLETKSTHCCHWSKTPNHSRSTPTMEILRKKLT